MKLLPVLALVTAALPVGTAAAQSPGLPRTFNPQVVNTPLPLGGGSFGWGLASADLTGDNKLDLLVAQGQTAPTRVFIFDGASGAHIDTIAPPELNPGGDDPVIAFVYVETMPDIGSCPGGDGGDADKICDLPVIAAGDGIPEILVGARGLRVNATDGALPPVAPDPDATPPVVGDPAIGRGYVIDGRTRAVLKRIDMPQIDRQAQASFTTNTPSPQFGRVMASPQALPPCAGLGSENNNQGVGPCPDMPRRSRIGDLDGAGQPDIVITARNYVETSQEPGDPGSIAATLAAASGSQCQNATSGGATPVRCTSGKAWTYRGEDIVGTNPQTILDTPLHTIKNPRAQTGGQEFGGNLYRVGDITQSAECFTNPAAASCAPEYVIPARNLSYPLASPSTEFQGTGAAFLFNGANGMPLDIPGGGGNAIISPEPQRLSQFGGSFNGGRPVGDLGATTAPDILLPAALQNSSLTDDGKIWVFNGLGGGGGATGSWQFASMTDPTPQPGGNFGGAFSGAGDVVPGPDSPANELLVGGFRFDPFTAGTRYVEDVHFVNVQTARNLMTIPNPTGKFEEGFGVGLVPMGDLNGDGFLDFAASSYLASVNIGGDGQAWIFRSDNSPLPQPAGPAPVAEGPAATPAAPTVQEVALRPGRCANQTLGTNALDSLRGTIAGDQIFGFAGNDRIRGFDGQDCLDGGSGRDRLEGGNDADKIIGGAGNDRLDGGNDRDRLYGVTGQDRLSGNGGNDMLAGGSSNDRLYGGIGNDQLFGEAGTDRIVGGPGVNRIDGGSGNDSIDARNGRRDRVICGTGRDRVRADRIDRLNGCERVTFGGRIG
ncbi:MAG: calcium-binding protein [Solirubrobacteraceae bacterium]|nr:calcium-binding protein [Solirubrobacteraceae bacterium]